MTNSAHIRPNALGDLSAEADHSMLRQAFLETADYRTLIETSDRIVVVGRRGTGKSALALRLRQFYRREDKTQVVLIAPEEHQTIGLRPRIARFGETFSKMRAAARFGVAFRPNDGDCRCTVTHVQIQEEPAFWQHQTPFGSLDRSRIRHF